MPKSEAGELEQGRVRLWGGQLVKCIILKKLPFLRLVIWNVEESWDGTPPFSHYSTTKWYPSWRVIE